MDDVSAGWDAVATAFIAGRSPSIGVATVRGWANQLPPGGSILDLGCGHGVPISAALLQDGFSVYGVDASQTLVGEFRRHLPGAPVNCEAVETSAFFNRHFDAAVAIGLVFLLSEDAQRQLLHRISRVLLPGGRLLFTAPRQAAVWTDNLTGRESRSLGWEAYGVLLRKAGLEPEAGHTDEGDNHYYSAARPLQPSPSRPHAAHRDT